MVTSRGDKRKAIEARNKVEEGHSDEAESLESSSSRKYTKRVVRVRVKKEKSPVGLVTKGPYFVSHGRAVRSQGDGHHQGKRQSPKGP